MAGVRLVKAVKEYGSTRVIHDVDLDIDVTVGDVVIAGTAILITFRCVIYQYDLAPELNVFHQIKVLGISSQIFHILFDGGVVGADCRILIETKVGKCSNILG